MNTPLLADPQIALNVFAGFAFVFGLLVGSFLNVVIGRLPKEQSVVYPGSHCPHCGNPVRPYDNIPVISWLILRAKCRDCGSPISSLYPTIELMMGCTALLLYFQIFPSIAYFTAGNITAFCCISSFCPLWSQDHLLILNIILFGFSKYLCCTVCHWWYVAPTVSRCFSCYYVEGVCIGGIFWRRSIGVVAVYGG